MNHEPNATDASATKRGRGRVRRGVLATVVALVLVGGFLVGYAVHFDSRFAWLSPSEIAALQSRGNYYALRNRLEGWWEEMRYRVLGPDRLTSIELALDVFDLSPAAELGLGDAAAATDDGMRAWILTPPQMIALRSWAEWLDKKQHLSFGPIGLDDEFNAIGMELGVGISFGKPLTTLKLSALSKRAFGRVRLWAHATLTEPIAHLPEATTVARVYPFPDFRATVADGGGLLLEQRGPPGPGAGSRWLLLSPKIVPRR